MVNKILISKDCPIRLRIARRAINECKLASRKLGGHAYWASFRIIKILYILVY